MSLSSLPFSCLIKPARSFDSPLDLRSWASANRVGSTRANYALRYPHGEPVAKLVPVSNDTDEIFGFFSGKGSVTGDVVSPALSSEEWGKLL